MEAISTLPNNDVCLIQELSRTARSKCKKMIMPNQDSPELGNGPTGGQRRNAESAQEA
jgi:hypothetical protein